MRASRTRTEEPTTVDTEVPEVTPEEQQQLAMRDQLPAEMYRSNAYTDDELRGATTFDEFVALAAEKFDQVDDVSEVLGDGFAVLKDNKRLVGVPLLFLEWNFYPGKFGSNFVACRVIARNDNGSAQKYIINDGSTGIAEQLAAYTKDTGRTGGLGARHGLRASDYIYCGQCERAVDPKTDAQHAKDHIPAATYYIDTAV